MKRTFQPSNRKKKNTHGFRERSSTAGGQKVLQRRRKKGRKKLAVQFAGIFLDFAVLKSRLSPKKKKTQKGSAEAKKIFESRRKTQQSFLITYWRLLPEGEKPKTRLFLSVSKKVFSLAHDRNRTKRLVREIYRQWGGEKKEKYQIMVRLIKTPGEMTTPCFRETLEPVFKKIFV